MDIRFQQGRIADVDAEVLVVAAWEKDTPRDVALNEATDGWLEEVYASGEFAGNAGDLAILHRPKG